MTLRNLLPLAILALAIGCSADSRDDIDPNRGPLGKVDSIGSCEGACGGQSPAGDCWCDDQCTFYGDCCDDKVDECDAPQQQNCGGFAGLACPTDQYCHYEADDICGFADAMGVCMDLPEACIEIFSPVCGCDGVTYSNSCFANAAGTSVQYQGACNGGDSDLCLTDDDCEDGSTCDDTDCHMPPCPPGMACPQVCMGICQDDTIFCGGFGNIACPDGMECADDPNDDCDPANGGADCGGVCVPSEICPPVVCTLACDEFQKDENGCDICACAPAGDSCEGSCGSASADGSCYCDKLCESYGDCCDDFTAECSREPASGMCVKNSNDQCTTDADCVAGGCGGELCYNPNVSNGISTCECTTPTNVTGCGCVAGQCTWWN
jgi:hypothetical protein